MYSAHFPKSVPDEWKNGKFSHVSGKVPAPGGQGGSGGISLRSAGSESAEGAAAAAFAGYGADSAALVHARLQFQIVGQLRIIQLITHERP